MPTAHNHTHFQKQECKINGFFVIGKPEGEFTRQLR